MVGAANDAIAILLDKCNMRSDSRIFKDIQGYSRIQRVLMLVVMKGAKACSDDVLLGSDNANENEDNADDDDDESTFYCRKDL